MQVVVIGTGYVGLVSGVCLGGKGHDVTCVDANPAVVEQLRSGRPHIHERGLPELLAEVLAKGRINFSSDLRGALDRAELVLVAVGTPSVDGVIDLRYIRAVAREIGGYLAGTDRFLSVVVKSTVVPGTTDTVMREEIEAVSGKRFPAFGLGMNPEFLREGEAIDDFMNPDRIVFGHDDPQTLALLEQLYAPWSCDKVQVNTRTAELIKYANNSLLAVQISAVNEIANLAAAVGGIDIAEVMHGVHLDKRWSPTIGGQRITPGILRYLLPGCGFGGSCFPKDVAALRSQGRGLGLDMRILNGVLAVNREQPGQVAAGIEQQVGALAGKRALVLGLAFKPGTDDVRESSSLHIVSDLLAKGMEVTAHDPIARHNFARAMEESGGAQPQYVDDWGAAVAEAEVIIIATAWDEYTRLTDADLSGKTVFDARRQLDRARVGNAAYLSIGLST